MIDMWGNTIKLNDSVNFRYGRKYLNGKITHLDFGDERVNVYVPGIDTFNLPAYNVALEKNDVKVES